MAIFNFRVTLKIDKDAEPLLRIETDYRSARYENERRREGAPKNRETHVFFKGSSEKDYEDEEEDSSATPRKKALCHSV